MRTASVAEATEGVEIVLHLGAQIAIPYSYVNPRDFIETNVVGSLNVAQAALRAGVERVVHTSTSEVYGTAQTVPITETHPLVGQSPYAASKIGADQLMDSFHRSFDLPVTVLRPFNTYGPFQSARAVIPTIISQALAGGPVRLGSLHPRRDLTFVTDTACARRAARSSCCSPNPPWPRSCSAGSRPSACATACGRPSSGSKPTAVATGSTNTSADPVPRSAQCTLRSRFRCSCRSATWTTSLTTLESPVALMWPVSAARR